MNKVKVTEESLKEVVGEAVLSFITKTRPETDEIVKLLLAKNADYGDAWQRFDIFTPLVRLNDKLLRVKTLSDGRTALVPGEKITDTLVDIVGYGLLALLKLKHSKDSVDITVEEALIQSIAEIEESSEETFEPSNDDIEWLNRNTSAMEQGVGRLA
ncbi:MAG: nucleotide modification associated domain-containing protein [Candidatus Izemoplasmatales bacterium]